MHGTPILLAPAKTNSFSNAAIVPMGERIVYALLGLVLIGAMVPIGPAIPLGEHGAIATACHGYANAGWHRVPCAVDDRLALASPLTAAETAALVP